MVKKIMKYAKFMVCIILMVSLIAPSYAALSASDGSAFVTKAEFDSALADFNSRLTTFEAGINSKIDSQVTSYLDRNGIWNGVTQTPVKSTYYINALEMFNIAVADRIDYTGYTNMGPSNIWTYRSWEDIKEDTFVRTRDSGTYSGYITFRPDSSITAPEDGVWFIEYHIGKTGGSTPSTSFCFPQDLFVATKSGLAFVSVRQSKNQTTYLQYVIAAKYSGNQSWYADHADSVDLGYAFTVNDTVSVRKSIWSLTATGSSFYSAATIHDQFYGGYSGSHAGGAKTFTVPLSQYDATDKFFVQKGDRVAFAPSPIINMNSAHTNRLCTWYPSRVVPTDTSGTWPSACRWEFSFPEITIY